jgi:hypothetical protein
MSNDFMTFRIEMTAFKIVSVPTIIKVGVKVFLKLQTEILHLKILVATMTEEAKARSIIDQF